MQVVPTVKIPNPNVKSLTPMYETTRQESILTCSTAPLCVGLSRARGLPEGVLVEEVGADVTRVDEADLAAGPQLRKAGQAVTRDVRVVPGLEQSV